VDHRVTYQSEVAELRRALLKHAQDAFRSAEWIAGEWRKLAYLGPPDYDRACRECDAFASLLEGFGVSIEWLPRDDTGLDSIYVRDASVVSDAGVVLGRMGKPARAGEPRAHGSFLREAGLGMAGAIDGEATLEGGDVAWLDPSTLAVGRSERTTEAGIEQLEALVDSSVDVLRVRLPLWRGPGDVFHLMSVVSPLAEDLLLVYPPLLPSSFREWVLERGYALVEVPDTEFTTLACNVLAIAPRVVVALDGNPVTRGRMEAAGVEVHEYVGTEVSRKGCGGPTCLVRTLERAL
jgi:N-dimethylarginine dimethylaminohydrolase